VGDSLHAPLFCLSSASPQEDIFLAQFWITSLQVKNAYSGTWVEYKGFEGPNQPFADGNWHQLVTAVRTNRLDVYFDGKPVVWITLPPPASTWNLPDGDFWIGYAPLSYYDGGLDDVRVYDRALEADEVTSLYNVEAVLPAEELAVYQAVELQFITNVGFHYALETSADLVTWKPWGDVFEGTGQATSILVSVKGTGQSFWRLYRVN
jgi:hypothetical protein